MYQKALLRRASLSILVIKSERKTNSVVLFAEFRGCKQTHCVEEPRFAFWRGPTISTLDHLKTSTRILRTITLANIPGADSTIHFSRLIPRCFKLGQRQHTREQPYKVILCGATVMLYCLKCSLALV